MLMLLETSKEKLAAHNLLEARLRSAWHNRETRTVVWRPDSRRMTIYHNGKFWFGTIRPNPDDTTPRTWSPFGEYRKSGTLQIAVELNVPTRSNERRVAGFLARDTHTGITYLMHSGGVGGGRKGVGKAAFLAWSGSRPTTVVDSKGDHRLGVIVAPVDSATTAIDISIFVQSTIDFKSAVSRGETSTREARTAQQQYEDYYDEFSGKKRRARIEELEYVSRHGDIVRALSEWRRPKSSTQEKVVKNLYIDLGIEIDGTLTEIYEVKTNCERPSFYSAVGQIVVHDRNHNCKRVLVIPAGERVPDDIRDALLRAKIALLRFDVQGERVRILER